MTTKKILFSFDEDSYKNILELQAQLGAKSIAETLRRSLEMMSVLETQASEGYSEIVLRNNSDKKEKTIVAPSFFSRKKKINSENRAG